MLKALNVWMSQWSDKTFISLLGKKKFLKSIHEAIILRIIPTYSTQSSLNKKTLSSANITFITVSPMHTMSRGESAIVHPLVWHMYDC